MMAIQRGMRHQLSFSGGAFSFPILPAPHILAFFFACGLVCLFVAARLREGSCGDGTLMVVAVSAGSLFAALGRCDAGHVGLAGIGIVIVATLLASGFPQLWKAYRVAFLLLFIILPALTGLWSYRTLISKVVFMRIFQVEPQGPPTRMDALIEHGMQRALGKNKGQIDFEKLKAASAISTNVDFAVFPQFAGTLQAPFGFSPRGFGSYHSANIATGYFDGSVNAFTPPMVHRKIDELRAHTDRQLLLPDNFDNQCQVDAAADRRLIQGLFLYPFRGRIRHDDSVLEPFCDYIDKHYYRAADLGPETRGYSLWAPR